MQTTRSIPRDSRNDRRRDGTAGSADGLRRADIYARTAAERAKGRRAGKENGMKTIRTICGTKGVTLHVLCPPHIEKVYEYIVKPMGDDCLVNLDGGRSLEGLVSSFLKAAIAIGEGKRDCQEFYTDDPGEDWTKLVDGICAIIRASDL